MKEKISYFYDPKTGKESLLNTGDLPSKVVQKYHAERRKRTGWYNPEFINKFNKMIEAGDIEYKKTGRNEFDYKFKKPTPMPPMVFTRQQQLDKKTNDSRRKQKTKKPTELKNLLSEIALGCIGRKISADIAKKYFNEHQDNFAHYPDGVLAKFKSASPRQMRRWFPPPRP